jgi:hypothetical protein
MPHVANEPKIPLGSQTMQSIINTFNPNNGPETRENGSIAKAREAWINRDINKRTQQTVDQATKLSHTAGERIKNQFGSKPVTPATPTTAAAKPVEAPTTAAQQAVAPPKQASTARSEVGASAQANVPDNRFKPTPPAPSTAQVRAAPAAAQPVPPPVSTADTGGDKYGSGNASAGFERGKYAAPDASDNSSDANELRSKQATADRGNLGESKTKYMSESITFERFLRNR